MPVLRWTTAKHRELPAQKILPMPDLLEKVSRPSQKDANSFQS